jgi:FMN phosphatase YigB (HAD superfamily)
VIQAVVLGVGGVLAPVAAIGHAEIAAAADWLDARGHRGTEFRRAAAQRYGMPAWVAVALRDAGIALAPADRARLVLACRDAIPAAAPSPHRAALRALSARWVTGALDCGPRRRLDGWFDRLGLDDLLRHRLCTEELGLAGRPPRPTAFRFMQRRLDLRPAECAYVAGTHALALAATTAGWRVLELAAPAAPNFDWDTCLADLCGER